MKKIFIFFFLLSVTIATRVFIGVKFFEQILKRIMQETFQPSFIEIGPEVYGEIYLKEKVYGRTDAERKVIT